MQLIYHIIEQVPSVPVPEIETNPPVRQGHGISTRLPGECVRHGSIVFVSRCKWRRRRDRFFRGQLACWNVMLQGGRR